MNPPRYVAMSSIRCGGTLAPLPGLALLVLIATICALTTSACSNASEPTVASSRLSPLVSYREGGGFGAPRPSLIVSKRRRASVSLGACRTRFVLGRKAWRRLRRVLRNTDLAAVAGDYPPPADYADAITYTIRSGPNRVRIAPAPIPEYEAVMRELEPLRRALKDIVSAGKRRMPRSCRSNRVPQDTQGGGR